MNDLKQQIISARDERETGDASKALQMFLSIDKSQLEGSQLFDYLGELGLTYWHLKKFTEGRETFEAAKELAEKSNDNSHLAVALRHLSRPEFNKSNPNDALGFAQRARQLAFESSRQDLAWFDHGVVTALIFSKGSLDEVKKWFDIESEDIYKVSGNTKDEIAKWVWVSGLLMDRAKVFNTIGDLYIALTIAEHFGLSRRKEQIEELITEFNKI